MANTRKGKMGPWQASAQHDGDAELKVFTSGVAASANVRTDANFPTAKPATNPAGPLLLRNPHATFKMWFRFGADPTAADTLSFRLDPSESIMIPAGVSDLRFISDNASHLIHMILFY